MFPRWPKLSRLRIRWLADVAPRASVWVAALLVAAVVHADVTPTMPAGWERMAGRGPDRAPARCDLGVDNDLAKDDRPNMTIRCDEARAGFGGLQQAFAADRYRGKRVRLSAMLKSRRIRDTDGLDGVGSLWLRIEGDRPARALVRENARDRGVRGTTDWTPLDVVSDIPDDARRILIGVWMQGRGQVWISDIKFEEVDAEVPVSSELRPARDGPRNLDLQ